MKTPQLPPLAGMTPLWKTILRDGRIEIKTERDSIAFADTIENEKTAKRIVQAVNEYDALLAVAEAAESFKAVGQYWLNYPLGIPMSAWSVDDRTRYVAAEKMLNKALANLAAVREGKAVGSALNWAMSVMFRKITPPPHGRKKSLKPVPEALKLEIF